MKLADINEPVILLRVNQLYRPGMAGIDLYDVTRGVWVASAERRARVKLAFAVFKGTIKGVYQIEKWHPAGTTVYASGRKIDLVKHSKRWEFTGSPATPGVAAKYINQKVPPSARAIRLDMSMHSSSN
jgi:uncharacterized protein